MLKDWLNLRRFALLLAVLLAASFPMVLLGLKAFAYGDAGQFAYPNAFYFRHAFWRGEFPFWNPLNSCGIPFMAQWNTMTLYPPSLFYLLLPVPWSFGVFCVAHLFLGGLAMYALAIRWTGNRIGSALAGMVFAFNGLTWYGVMWPHILAGLAWMPVAVLTMERAWLEGGKSIAVAAFVGGMQLLSGGAEVILLTWIVLLLLWFICFFREKAIRGKIAGRGLCAAVLAAGLAMVQLLPFLKLLAHSQRTSNYAGSDIGKVAAMPLSGWANFLVPLFRCRPNFAGVYMQNGQNWTGSYYLSVAVVLLALFAIWRARHWRITMLTVVAAFGLIMALGPAGFIYDAVIHIVPGLGFIRFPVKFVILAVFAVPLLAAFGLACLIDRESDEHCTQAKYLAFGLLVLIAALAWAGRAGGPNTALRCLFLLATVMCIPFLAKARLAQVALVVFAWLDVLTCAPDLSPAVSASAWQPDSVRQFFHWDDQLRPGSSRAMMSTESFWKMLSAGLSDPDLDLQGRRLSLFMDLNLMDTVPKFDGFYSMDVKEYLNIFKHVYFTTNNSSALLDFLAVSEAGDPTNVVGWQPRPTSHPMITAGQQPVFIPPGETLDALFSNSFAPGAQVYLPIDAQQQVRATRSPDAQVLSPHFHADRVDFGVDSRAPAMVVVAQTFYPAWKAYVDGQRVRLWRANYAFQALECPAGRHQIALRYEDRSFFFGAAISFASLVVCAALLKPSRMRFFHS